MRLIWWIKSLFHRKNKYSALEKILMLGELAYRLDPEAEAYDFHSDCGDR